MDRLTDLFLDCYSEEELERIHDMAVEFARLIEGIYVQSGGKGIGMIPTVDDIVRAATRAYDEINELRWEKRFAEAPYVALMHYPIAEPEVRFLQVCPL